MSIVHVTGSRKSGIPVDRTLFVGPKIPDEIKTMVKQLKHVDKSTLRKLLQVIVDALEGKSVKYHQVAALQTETLTEELLGTVYTGLYRLLKMAIRLPKTSLKPEIFKEDLQELKIPDDFIPDIASVVFGTKRVSIDSHAAINRPHLPKIQTLRWRLDVAISTSVLNRALEPAVLMEITLNDGAIHEFEVPVSKFHELRYNVAYMLKEMGDLEKRSILKIQD